MAEAPLRIGLVGYGKIARDQHAPAIRRAPGLVLAAACHLGPGAPLADAPAFADLEAMLDGAELDAVAVCTPPRPRHRLAARALERGLHVLLEKPACATLGEVRDLQRRAAAAGRTAFAAYHSRANAAVAAARSALEGATLRRLQVDWREDVRRWHPGQDWVFAAGGFGVFDPGLNALSILTAVSPEPLFVTAAEFGVPAGRQAPIAAALRFAASDPRAKLEAVFDWRETEVETWSLAIDTACGRRCVLREGGARLHVDGVERPAPHGREYDGVYARFLRLVREGACDLDDRPLVLAADAFLVAGRRTLEPFAFSTAPAREPGR